jgi:uncharacterized protein (DUF2267 family)
MRMRKTLGHVVDVGAGALGSVAVLGGGTRVGGVLRHAGELATRRGRYAQGRLEGLRYRLAGRVPDACVPDDVLTRRIRSGLGGLEKRLDIPRVQVVVDGHFVVLHGDVGSVSDAEAVERWVRHTPGVRGVESYLHIGLSPGSTRPSTGRAQWAARPSEALQRLVGAAQAAGAAPDEARRAIRGVLSTFAERLPIEERRHLFAHLPEDVRVLAAPPRRHPEGHARLRTGSDLVVAAAWAGVAAEDAEAITEGVLGCLRQLVPEEVVHVAAVLPNDLRRLWASVDGQPPPVRDPNGPGCPAPQGPDADSSAGYLGGALAEDGEI